jgi:UPF0755 protein
MAYKNKVIIIALSLTVILAGLFYFRNKVYYSHGNYSGKKMFEIEKGEGNAQIASRLEEENLVSGNIYFYYYIRSHGVLNRIMPGEYELSGQMTIPEIVHIITNSEKKFIKITFPEGFTAEQMSERLNNNNLSGEKFLEIVKNPGDFKKRYGYFQNAATLEGYLFPDTYFFKPDITAENIVGRMLDTFDEKLDSDLRQTISGQERSIKEIVTMASIIEKEVQTPEDMKIVSGIFWNRIKIGQRLQSDAPLSYILNDKEDSHNAKDLNFDSPYNTYRYAGLPPAPIGNPGLNAINASVYPTVSNYNYFLTATVDGAKKVIYSKTFEEHVANKNKYGL